MLKTDYFKKNIQNKEISFAELKETTDSFIETWKDDPAWLSGWRHYYFCDQDGTFLAYDKQKPFEHRCSTCGTIYTDDKKNGTWVTITRNHSLTVMKNAAILYLKTGENHYLAFVKKLLLFYAKNYRSFEIHIKNTILPDMSEYERVQKDLKANKVYFDPKDSDWTFKDYQINFQGPGKIMAQGLSEAVALIKMMFIYTILNEHFTEEEKILINEQLLLPAVEFLNKQQFIDHNITLWREVAIQIMRLVSGTFNQDDFKRPYGIYEHLTNGLTTDGFWYEGSIHYHHYVMEALGYLSLFLNWSGYQDDQLEAACTKMMTFSYELAFQNGVFPNPNDGWPNVNLKTYLNVFELLTASYPKKNEIQSIYQELFNLPINRVALPIEDELFFEKCSATGALILTDTPHSAKNNHKPSKYFLDTKLIVLRNKKFNLFLKYGVKTLSHAHYDPLTIEFTIANQLVSKDISNVGYGSELVRQWYNTPLGHNSVIVNEQLNNILYQSEIITKNEQQFSVKSNDIYPASEIIRSIALNDDSFAVESFAICEDATTIDFVQHIDLPQVHFSIEGTKIDLPNDFYAAQLTNKIVQEINLLKIEREFIAYLPDNGSLNFDVSDPCTLYLMRTIGNPSQESRYTLVFRFKNKPSAHVKMSYSD
ncbi:hypothetical protein IGI37_003686 [Enterococcus sp. AZ194]|uniref:heparinase II/III domain-containing protein n=1 Tax=Enterococcus sp. AZ194 TaxID=2774629 RepID=UPI003F286201